MGLTATEPDRRQIKPFGVLLVQIACTLARNSLLLNREFSYWATEFA